MAFDLAKDVKRVYRIHIYQGGKIYYLKQFKSTINHGRTYNEVKWTAAKNLALAMESRNKVDHIIKHVLSKYDTKISISHERADNE